MDMSLTPEDRDAVAAYDAAKAADTGVRISFEAALEELGDEPPTEQELSQAAAELTHPAA